MLRKARARVRTEALADVEGLAVMDAQRLGFRDGAFDVVVAQYVITVVPDPEATLDEFARVVKPGGEIALVNHTGAQAGISRPFRPSFQPVARQHRRRPGLTCRPPARSGPRPCAVGD